MVYKTTSGASKKPPLKLNNEASEYINEKIKVLAARECPSE